MLKYCSCCWTSHYFHSCNIFPFYCYERVVDQDGDEDDGYDETLIPVDFQRAGQIRDDNLLKHLVKPMSAGVTMTCLMDCCHSGTVLDLPYRFVADGDHVSYLIEVLVHFFNTSTMTHNCLFMLYLRLKWKKMKDLISVLGWMLRKVSWLQLLRPAWLGMLQI